MSNKQKQKRINYYGDGHWIEGGVRSSFEDANIIVMPGGGDWNPRLYNQKPIEGVYYSDRQDSFQMSMIDEAIKMGKAIFGICRGLQGLTIKAGGSLIQDSRHPSDHEVRNIDNELYSMNSCHHQMCIPYDLDPEDYELISWTEQLSPHHMTEGNIQYKFPEIALDERGEFKEPEVIFYPKLNAMGTQGHPEWNPGRDTLSYLNHLLRSRLKI